MSGQILIRNLPPSTSAWLNRESDRQNVSRNSFVLSVLEQARQRGQGPTLFDDLPEDSDSLARSAGGLPFSFIDLFSGIGGLRIGLESAGGRCLFSCEIDRFARRTYQAWFGETPVEDIQDFTTGAGVPAHDVLAAGFPCQPFSIAGVSKKKSLGRDHGFRDKAQGTLFFHLATIIESTRPPVLLLENVKNLRSHNRGDTWQTIATTLEELGYVVFDQIIDAADYVPQHRERIFIVGFDRAVFGDQPPFEFPDPPADSPSPIGELLQPEKEVDAKYVLSDHLWNYLQEYARRHKARGNGFGFGLADLQGRTRTLSARYYKDGSEILIPRGKDRNPRRLTPLEAGRLMGFPEHLIQHQVVSDTQAYKQFGNAVVPAVVSAIAGQIAEVMRWQVQRQGNGCLLASQPVAS